MNRASRSAATPSRLFWRLGIGLVFLLLSQLAQSQVAILDELPSTPLGLQMQLLVEKAAPLSLAEAKIQQQQGAFHPATSEVPKFGIGAKPVWLHLAVLNTSNAPVQRRLLVEISWIDRLDLYQAQDDRVVAQWAAGDGDASLQHPRPGAGYIFDLVFPPGQSALFLRAETPDPLVLPVRLLTLPQAETVLHQYDYGYGLLYGFLLALIAYNATLYVGLRERSHLDYSLYLGCFVVLNLAYTGHAYAWLWPQHASFQQYIILVLMVLFGCFGLRFASGFLKIRQHSPRLHHSVHAFILFGLTLLGLTILLQWQSAAVLVAFVFVLLFSAMMVWLGIDAVRRGSIAGRYFLAAALTSMIALMVTTLAVWHGLPFTPITFHAAGWGVVIEGTLLALALAYRVRKDQQARFEAEQLARIDPLTGLLNRRAFFAHAGPAWNSAVRNHRPLAVIMMDLDFFKRINDTHGHAMGDHVLMAVGRISTEVCRSSDIAARWGGEEFILLLPESSALQAIALAERLRERIAAIQLDEARQLPQLSASFGVVERREQASLEDLIRESDDCLYRAKKSGRNQVCGDIPATEKTKPLPSTGEQAA